MTAAASHVPGARSLVDIALVGVVALWVGLALVGPWAFVGYLAVLYGPAGVAPHFHATLGVLTDLGDFGPFLTWWLTSLTGL
jgi:hypothetical protein